jgi:hypothetical protein
VQRGATLSTLGVYKGDYREGEKKERKSEKVITRGASHPAVHVKRVEKNKWITHETSTCMLEFFYG